MVYDPHGIGHYIEPTLVKAGVPQSWRCSCSAYFTDYHAVLQHGMGNLYLPQSAQRGCVKAVGDYSHPIGVHFTFLLTPYEWTTIFR